jgi:hypothetical protein
MATYLYYGPILEQPTLDPSGVGMNFNAGSLAPRAKAEQSQGKPFAGNAGSWEVSGNLVNIDNSGRIVGSQGQRSLTLPFLALLNVPSLSMTEVTVDFLMTIKTQDRSRNQAASAAVSTNSTTQSYGASASGRWWGISFNASASGASTATTTAVVASSSDDKNESSTSSTYSVHMSARDKTPVGLKMMMDFITANADSMSAQKELAEDGYSLRDKGSANIFNIIGDIGKKPGQK